MVKIDSKLATTLPPIQEGIEVVVENVETVTTSVRGFKGIRVTLKSEHSGEEYVEMLWLRDVVGESSKLGAFISVLGDETDEWIGRKIKVLEWRPRQRLITLVGETRRRR